METATIDDTTTARRPRYDHYRASGIDWLGEIPAHWEPTRLRFRLQVGPSKSELEEREDLQPESEVPFLPMEAIGENGGLDLSKAKTLEDVVDGYTYFREGDVLVAKITPCFENGKGALAEGLKDRVGFGTTELHVLRPGSELDKQFLFYVTRAYSFRKIGAAWMYGAGGQKRVPDDFICNLRWPIPSLSEQCAIAAYLDREAARIDALVAKKERLIELLEEKRTALISRAVTRGLDPDVALKNSGVEWLGEIPAGWDVVQNGSEPATGSASSTHASKTVTDYLQQASTDLTDRFEELKAFCLNLGDDVQQKTLKYYFAFKRLKNFACVEVHPQSDQLLVYLKADFDEEVLQQRIERDDALRDVRQIGHYGTGDLEVRLRTAGDFERTQDLIAKSYEKS